MRKAQRFLRAASSVAFASAVAFTGLASPFSVPLTADAAEITGFTLSGDGSSDDKTVKGSKNMGTLDNSGNTTYWFGGNGFYGFQRSGKEFGEDYDTDDWLLVDNDAAWKDQYLYSTWGSAYRTDDNDTYTYSDDSSKNYYYQKILTYNEKLYQDKVKSQLSDTENSAIGTATVTTTNNEYRTFEDYVKATETQGNSYNYWVGGTTYDALSSSKVSKVKKWYESGSTDTTKYLDVKSSTGSGSGKSSGDSAVTWTNGTRAISSSAGYNGIGDYDLGVKSSNLYSLIGAHFYSPSVAEYQANESAYKKIISNIRNDATGSTNENVDLSSYTAVPSGKTGYPSAKQSAWGSATANPTGNLWDRTRTDLWSRSFSGLHVNDGTFDAWFVYVYGNLNSYNNLTDSKAVAPAFNLDSSSVVMARSAKYAGAAGNNLFAFSGISSGSDVNFVLENTNIGISTGLNGKTITNAVAGKTYIVPYNGITKPSDSAKYYISAGIYDAGGNLLYYGRLKDVTSDSSDGTVNVTIPSLDTGASYQFALFLEQDNGTENYSLPGGTNVTAYDTDYVSKMDVATLKMYHENVSIDDQNDSHVNENGYIYASSVVADFVTSSGEIISAVPSSSIRVVDSSEWETDVANGVTSSVLNGLGTEIQVPSTPQEISYYVVILDPEKEDGTGYWVGEKTTVTVVENQTGFDAETWYSYTDHDSEIVWVYKLDGSGNVIGLYTKSPTTAIDNIIDSGKCLNVPSKINGKTVVAIGGESSNEPFIPASSARWTSISFPDTVTTINDYAFIGSKAKADITIPTTVKAVGVMAFYGSEISSVRFSGLDGTIGSYAFGNTADLKTASIKGLGSGATISYVAFAGSGLESLSITGISTINKNAFINNNSLANITLNGTISVGESAFSDDSAISSLALGGTVTIGSYAFKNCTSLESLYLPVSTVLSEYSFNGCTGLMSLESDTSIPSHAFEGTGNISTIVLDNNCLSVAYDWEGNSTSFTERKLYVRNPATTFAMHHDGSSYYSAFGASGTVKVTFPDVAKGTYDYNQLASGSADSSDIVSYVYYLAGSADLASWYNADGATAVNFNSTSNVDTELRNDSITPASDSSSELVQTGISAYYSGSILTTKDIDKDKMTVTRLYGADEGKPYTSKEFYVVRTEEFKTEQSKEGGVTEEAIDAYEPLNAKETDLSSGQKSGTISATVVVFDENATNGYYSVAVSIRVEEYTAKSDIELEYGSYEELAEAISDYQDQMKKLEEAIAAGDADSADDLIKELNALKAEYADLVKQLSAYVDANKTNGNGYLGTTTDDSSGNITDVVYIKGNPVAYEETGAKDSSGNSIYSASYDADGDGTAETIYFIVSEDGVHLTDKDGNDVKADGTAPADGESGAVYSDTLAALERQLAAQVSDVKSQLDKAESGIEKLKNSVTDAGYNYDDLTGDSDYDKIASAIDDLSDKVSDLTDKNSALDSDLTVAQNKITNYQTALNSIYKKLTGEDLTEDQLSSLSDSLSLINAKIEKLQNDLAVAQASVTDLKSQLDSAQSEVSALQTELDSTKASLSETEGKLSEANAALETAKQDKADLTAQYEAAKEAGDEEAAAKLKEQIDAKDAAIAELETTQQELSATKANLEQKEADLKTAQDTVASLQEQITAKEQEIASLKSQVEALSGEAGGYTVTVDIANSMFDANLSSDATADQISDAVKTYVQAKLSNDATIKAIQDAVGTTDTGEALVADVTALKTKADSNTGSGDSGNTSAADYTGYTKDTDVNTSSASYKAGYDAGLTADKSSSSSDSGNTSGNNSGSNSSSSSGTAAANYTGYTKDTDTNLNFPHKKWA